MRKELAGMIFGKWKVLYLDEERNKLEKQRVKNGEIKKFKTFWICECMCDNHTIKSVSSDSLLNGRSFSCGCIQKEKASITNKKQNEYKFLENDIVKGWDDKHENCFLISKEDFEEISKIYWKKNMYGYWIGYDTSNKRTIKLHQLVCLIHYKDIYKLNGDLVPDHLNRNKDDNTYPNLQPKQRFENDRNRSINKKNKTGFKGVYFDDSIKYRKWVAFITDNSHKKLKKCFLTFEEAKEQRIKWENEFGYMR